MRRHRESVLVRRAVQVERIPSGEPIELEPGTMAEITQALGSNFTLHVDGLLVRLKGADADAIGKPLPASPSQAVGGEPVDLQEQVRHLLRPGDSGQHRRPRPGLRLRAHAHAERPHQGGDPDDAHRAGLRHGRSAGQ
jgi:hypothetical protein